MTTIESAWGKYPGYEINLVPCTATARVWHGDLLLAESDACLRVEETKHVDRLYFPEEHVHWQHFEANDHHSICPFKGEADYWSLTATEQPEENLVWTYRRPFDEVGGIEGYVAFYHEKVRIETRGAVARQRRRARSRRTGSRRGATRATCSGSSTSSRPDRTTSSRPRTATRRATSSKAVRCSRRPSSPRRRRCRTSA